MSIDRKILSEIERYRSINNYIIEQTEVVPPPPPGEDLGALAPAPGEVGVGAPPPPIAPPAPTTAPIDVANDPDVEKIDDEGKSDENGSGTQEMDITELVKSQQNIEKKMQKSNISPTKVQYYGIKIAKDAIEEGVNVFLEKPFCSNTNEAVELIRLAQKNKIFLYVDNVFLYRSELQNLIQKNYINIFHGFIHLCPSLALTIAINIVRFDYQYFQFMHSRDKFYVCKLFKLFLVENLFSAGITDTNELNITNWYN